MPRRYYSNVANPVYLVGTLDASSTTNTISVSVDPNGVTASPPGWPTTYPYFACIDQETAQEEIVLVTGGSGGTLNITRGTTLGALGYGTATKSHQSGAMLTHVVTAADSDEANAHINSSTAVHGLASGSAVVGTTDAQTLTNKTLSGGAVSGGGDVVGTTAVQTLTGKTLASPTATGTSTAGTTRIASPAAATVPLAVASAAGQTADLVQFVAAESGLPVARVTANGTLLAPNLGPDVPRAQVYLSANQGVSTATSTVLGPLTAGFSRGGLTTHLTGVGIPASGIYRVSAQARVSIGTPSSVHVALILRLANGTTLAAGYAALSAANISVHCAPVFIYIAEGQVVELVAQGATGATFIGQSAATYMSIEYVC